MDSPQAQNERHCLYQRSFPKIKAFSDPILSFKASTAKPVVLFFSKKDIIALASFNNISTCLKTESFKLVFFHFFLIRYVSKIPSWSFHMKISVDRFFVRVYAKTSLFLAPWSWYLVGWKNQQNIYLCWLFSAFQQGSIRSHHFNSFNPSTLVKSSLAILWLIRFPDTLDSNTKTLSFFQFQTQISSVQNRIWWQKLRTHKFKNNPP